MSLRLLEKEKGKGDRLIFMKLPCKKTKYKVELLTRTY